MSIGVKRFRLLAFVNSGKQHVGVALACRGPDGKTHFGALREAKTAIEAEVGDHLQWEEMPEQKSPTLCFGARAHHRMTLHNGPISMGGWCPG